MHSCEVAILWRQGISQSSRPAAFPVQFLAAAGQATARSHDACRDRPAQARARSRHTWRLKFIALHEEGQRGDAVRRAAGFKEAS
mmetsp:Transcript_74184/g.200636  ORF Transcript_74184/g.200636 Transcript_74184/m.200636 type:complete len:85 (+) Transcript_74184:657-911(+)